VTTIRKNVEKVPVASLKAKLAHYLTRLKVGHSLVVTDHGQAVAVFVPVAWDLEKDEAMNQLVRTGQVTPPSQELADDFFKTPRVKDLDCSLRRFLLEERECGR